MKGIMKALCQAGAIAVALLIPSTLAAQDADVSIEQACARFKNWQPGPAARATEADRKAFGREKNCFGHFYSADVKPDYDKGRRCCLVRGDCNRELAMTFANGWSTPRDFDTATYFLCRAGDEMAPFEQEGMIEFVQSMRAGKEKGPLDYCDHVTSGAGATWCTGLDYDQKQVGWQSRISLVEKTLEPEAKKALGTLQKAADDLIPADGAVIAEPNRGGTIYPSMALGGEIERREVFVATLERYTRSRAPKATPEALKTADAALNAAYKARMAEMKQNDKEMEQGTTSQDVLRDAQRAWIPYRDAWTAFYRLRWKGAAPPEALDQEIEAALSRDRSKELAEMGAVEE